MFIIQDATEKFTKTEQPVDLLREHLMPVIDKLSLQEVFSIFNTLELIRDHFMVPYADDVTKKMGRVNSGVIEAMARSL